MASLHVVLHRPIYPRNVGMCARAMANFAASRLIVVGPQCDLAHEEAKQGAAHAQAILRNATVYASHTELLAQEGDGIRIALSGRDGRLRLPEYLDTVLDAMTADADHAIHAPAIPIYLYFGPEDDGLSNEEMELCHHVCRLPTVGEITSLNLSHAVLLSLYMVQTSLQGVRLAPAGSVRGTPHAEAAQAHHESPTNQPAYYPSETIKRWLEALGFDLTARRVNIEKTLNRILLSRCPTIEELRIIDSVLQQTVRKLTSR